MRELFIFHIPETMMIAAFMFIALDIKIKDKYNIFSYIILNVMLNVLMPSNHTAINPVLCLTFIFIFVKIFYNEFRIMKILISEICLFLFMMTTEIVAYVCVFLFFGYSYNNTLESNGGMFFYMIISRIIQLIFIFIIFKRKESDTYVKRISK